MNGMGRRVASEDAFSILENWHGFATLNPTDLFKG
jgi:hypothetical protein